MIEAKNFLINAISGAVKFMAGKTILSNNFGKLVALLAGGVYKIKLDSGRVVKIFADEINTEYSTLSRLFFNTYERHERKLLKKYFTGTDLIIELGSSLGVITSELAEKHGNSKIITVEANEKLISNLKKTLQSNFPSVEFVVINSCISDDEHKFSYVSGGDSLAGHIIENAPDHSGRRIGSADLIKLIKTHGCSKYSLVSDIEGAEYFLIFAKNGLLDQCQEISIELHDFLIGDEIVSIAQMRNELISKGFDLVSVSGRAHYFRR